MDDFFNFVSNNWQWLLTCLVATINFIVSICRKKIVIKDDNFSLLLEKLPEFISEAEVSGLTGAQKKAVVFSCCLSYLTALSGESQDFISKKYGDRILVGIEKILETPQKK